MKKNIRIVLVKALIINLLLTVVVLTVGVIAFAQENNLITETTCDCVKIKAVTECVNEYPGFSECTKQEFIFINKKTGKTTEKIASGELVASKDAKGNILGKYLDALAFSFACVKGKNKYYLIVGYYTGGNCDECEWYEFYDLNGKLLLSSRGLHTENDHKKYNETYKSLGLPKQWPRKEFKNIKLRKESK